MNSSSKIPFKASSFSSYSERFCYRHGFDDKSGLAEIMSGYLRFYGNHNISISLKTGAAVIHPLAEQVLTKTTTFALDLLAKDTGIALDLVHSAKLPAPILALTQSLFRAASDTAEPNSDFSASVKMLERWTNITLE